MEQFLKKFFNDNSVCVGLCDLNRKTVEVKPVYPQQLSNAPAAQQKYSQPQMQNYFSSQAAQYKQSVYAPQKTQPQQIQAANNVVSQKPKKQTLAQKFAAQQQAYAAQQAYIAQQRQKYAAQQAAQHSVQQRTVQQRTVQQKPVYSEAKPLFVSPNSYIQQTPQQHPQSRVIVNGNMKKVISAAVPAARYQ